MRMKKILMVLLAAALVLGLAVPLMASMATDDTADGYRHAQTTSDAGDKSCDNCCVLGILGSPEIDYVYTVFYRGNGEMVMNVVPTMPVATASWDLYEREEEDGKLQTQCCNVQVVQFIVMAENHVFQVIGPNPGLCLRVERSEMAFCGNCFITLGTRSLILPGCGSTHR